MYLTNSKMKEIVSGEGQHFCSRNIQWLHSLLYVGLMYTVRSYQARPICILFPTTGMVYLWSCCLSVSLCDSLQLKAAERDKHSRHDSAHMQTFGLDLPGLHRVAGVMVAENDTRGVHFLRLDFLKTRPTIGIIPAKHRQSVSIASGLLFVFWCKKGR